MGYRHNHRFDMVLHGRLILSDRPDIRVVTRDISLRGASLECLARGVRAHDRAMLVLQAEDDSLLSLTLAGHVAYVRQGVCGLTFDAIDVEDFAELYRLLARSTRHRASIDDEIELGFVPAFRHWALDASPRHL
ncbi:PilZ domain-containing protein [Aquisalimonas sp. 2447]|uniref:PilZ domain-containing protein n=1 Tax=Aquisalimonas sp. 2447 TaxID=2740807 RepID=UPI00143238CC|nr:PilZ domain-containing protein [Aquisalimonas sp. 2447]QIT56519.1 PilZ domain-containing protein [Aquisalimonas sp. 2447]